MSDCSADGNIMCRSATVVCTNVPAHSDGALTWTDGQLPTAEALRPGRRGLESWLQLQNTRAEDVASALYDGVVYEHGLRAHL